MLRLPPQLAKRNPTLSSSPGMKRRHTVSVGARNGVDLDTEHDHLAMTITPHWLYTALPHRRPYGKREEVQGTVAHVAVPEHLGLSDVLVCCRGISNGTTKQWPRR